MHPPTNHEKLKHRGGGRVYVSAPETRSTLRPNEGEGCHTMFLYRSRQGKIEREQSIDALDVLFFQLNNITNPYISSLSVKTLEIAISKLRFEKFTSLLGTYVGEFNVLKIKMGFEDWTRS